MESTIRKITSIDNDAENLRKNSDALLENKKRELENELQRMAEQAEVDLTAEKKYIIEQKLYSASLEAERVLETKEKEMRQIKEKYYKVKSDIVYELFNKLKDSIREGC